MKKGDPFPYNEGVATEKQTWVDESKKLQSCDDILFWHKQYQTAMDSIIIHEMALSEMQAAEIIRLNTELIKERKPPGFLQHPITHISIGILVGFGLSRL